MIDGWDPGIEGLLLFLGGVILVAGLLWLDFWVVRSAAHTRDR